MPGRFVRPHEGMTRTQSPPRKTANRRAPVALLAVFLMLVILALAWSVLSSAGGYEEARAQSSGEDELAQGPGESGNPGTEDSGASYSAFGEPESPFDPVVAQADSDGAQASTGDGDTQASAGDDGARASTGGDSNTGAGPTTDDATGSGSDDGADDSTGPAPSGARPNGTAPAPGGARADCSGLDDFERLICEEERGGAGGGGSSGGAPAGAPGTGTQQGPPGSGGVGRSGADEPAEQFRNGGGGVVK